MRCVKVFFLLFICVSLSASEFKYATFLIPEELKENAEAVVRESDIVFEVRSPSSATKRVTFAITVLKDSGEDWAYFVKYFNKTQNIKFQKGTVYDLMGNKVRSINEKDLKERSAVDGSTMFEDSRMLYYEPIEKKYPYTVEYIYEVQYSDLINYPDWSPVIYYNISVEHASFTVRIPKDMAFRYEEIRLEDSVSIKDEKNLKIYNWELTDHPAYEAEPYSPGFSGIAPGVTLAPIKFKYEGHEGSMETWESLGLWSYNLIKGRDSLPEETYWMIQERVAEIEDREELIREIYSYVQSRTRYVSIQFGIGGFQPFPAYEVDEKGYGDCKALTNYTKALLFAAGIESYYSLVKSGRWARDIYLDMPNNQFNHVFLCVPHEGDTIWLECTNQENPFGYIGNSTDNRHVLLITEEGGKIAKTRVYKQDENLLIRNANVILDENGNGNVNISTRYTGLQYDELSPILTASHEDKVKWYQQQLDIAGFHLNDFSHEVVSGPVPEVTAHLDLDLRNYASITGKRMFLPLNILSNYIHPPTKCRERKTDVLLKAEFCDSDTIIYQIPEVWQVEHVVDDVHLESPFGEYTATVTVKDQTIIYIRNYKRNKGRFPSEAYQEFYDFLKKVYKADNAKVVLIRI